MLSTTLLPVALIILLGLLFKRRQLVSDQFWKESDRIVYYIFFPCLLVSRIASMNLAEVEFLKIGSIITVTLLLLGSLLIFAMPTATSAYILADQLGGDQPTMAKIITIQTLVSAATLSVTLLWIANSPLL